MLKSQGEVSGWVGQQSSTQTPGVRWDCQDSMGSKARKTRQLLCWSVGEWTYVSVYDCGWPWKSMSCQGVHTQAGGPNFNLQNLGLGDTSVTPAWGRCRCYRCSRPRISCALRQEISSLFRKQDSRLMLWKSLAASTVSYSFCRNSVATWGWSSVSYLPKGTSVTISKLTAIKMQVWAFYR